MLFMTKRRNHCDIHQFVASNFLVNFRAIFVASLVFNNLPDRSKTKNLWKVQSLSLTKVHQRDSSHKSREHPIFHFVCKFSTFTVSHLELPKSVSDLTRRFSNCFCSHHENIQQLFFVLFCPICILIFLKSILSINRLVITQISSKVITSQWWCPFKCIWHEIFYLIFLFVSCVINSLRI